MTAVLIYATAGSQEEALAVGRTIVGERLAACANVFPAISSLYWWQGKLQEDQEAALILKTRKDLADAVIDRVKKLHSYECPCVVALPIEAGNEDFLKWIVEQTKQ